MTRPLTKTQLFLMAAPIGWQRQLALKELMKPRFGGGIVLAALLACTVAGNRGVGEGRESRDVGQDDVLDPRCGSANAAHQ